MNRLSFIIIACTIISGLESSAQNLFPASGNVGIGTLSPTVELDVNGSINASQLLLNGSPIQQSPWTTAGNNVYYDAGNIGVGTTNPGFQLDVSGAVNATQLLLNGTPIETTQWTTSGNDVYYNSGNIGIGNTNPGFPLDVSGAVNATQLLINGTPIETPVWDVNGNDISYTQGTVGIGTTTVPTGYQFAVLGSIISEGVNVRLNGDWPDFVFKESYKLPRLEEVGEFIDEHGHLPNIPTEQKVKKDGVDLGEMDALLLQKIEELTLYTIEQDKQIKKLLEQNKILMENQESMKTKLANCEK